jgi:hypothetical protein
VEALWSEELRGVNERTQRTTGRTIRPVRVPSTCSLYLCSLGTLSATTAPHSEILPQKGKENHYAEGHR